MKLNLVYSFKAIQESDNWDKEYLRDNYVLWHCCDINSNRWQIYVSIHKHSAGIESATSVIKGTSRYKTRMIVLETYTPDQII